MSSTNRSNARDTHKSDYYITPQKHVDLFLENFFAKVAPEFVWWDDCVALDPCAGGDTSNDMPYPRALFEYGIYATTNDIREDSPASMHKDFLYWDKPIHCIEKRKDEWKKYNLVITNPPFNIALDIIKKSLELTEDNWYVVMLLRLNFFGSKSRFDFFKDNMPNYCFIHHERMSFTTWPTDSIEYAHFVWKKWKATDHTITYLI